MFSAIVFVLIVSIGYFSYQLFYEISSNNANNKIKSSIQSNVSIEEETSYEVGGYDESKFPSEVVEEKTIQSKNTVPIFKPSDIQPSKFIYADFKTLKSQNEDTVAWLWIPNTDINYPVVQTSNNTYYLRNNFDKKRNQAGWIFADYRSNFKTLDRNTVIYGHNQLDSSMFGDIKKLRNTEDWFKNNDNKFIYLATENASYVFKIISIYSTKPNPYYIQHGMDNDTEYRAFLDDIVSKNEVKDVYDEVSIFDKILTLSTCTNYGRSRLVVQAKLVKYNEI
jgi:sortase B